MSLIRDMLEEMDKADLVDLIIEYSDNGYYPIEFFTLESKNIFNAYEIENHWNGLYVAAQKENDKDQDRAADILGTGARLVFDIARRDLTTDEAKAICRTIVDDLNISAEEDGIGMKTDSEWLYLDVAEEISEFLEG